MAGAALECRALVKTFAGRRVLDGIDLSVEPGTIFGLLGPNGSGKTTTIRTSLGLYRPDGGSVEVLGSRNPLTVRQRTGYLPEERGLYARMKIQEQLAFLASIRGLSLAESSRRAAIWLDRVGLAPRAQSLTRELSKGNQQKVQVLAALLHDPDLMLLDEPFSGLDPINTEILRETLLQRQAAGRTIIFSSHRLEQVEELCDYVAIIHRGRLLASGLVSDLRKRSGKTLVELGFSLPSGSGKELEAFVQGLGSNTVIVHEQRASSLRLELKDGLTPDHVLRTALNAGPGAISRFEIVQPTLQEIFISVVGADDPHIAEQMAAEGRYSGSKSLTEG